jgi:hypothetical protein
MGAFCYHMRRRTSQNNLQRVPTNYKDHISGLGYKLVENEASREDGSITIRIDNATKLELYHNFLRP